MPSGHTKLSNDLPEDIKALLPPAGLF